ncbi:DUF427 domain-containing protein [Thermodesulfobacteriota bacterium]
MRTERIEPGPGQESVWDYPRPPRIEPTSKSVRVVFNEVVIAESTRSLRVLETSHPPVYYIPKEDVAMEYLRPSERVSGCEWKGIANYFTVRIGEREALDSAWGYKYPKPEFRAIRDHIAFYPSKMDACFVEQEIVKAQPGDFYGGWITKQIVGPFKGAPGTHGW